MPESDLTFYDLLGVSSDASDADIERAYRALLPKVHPDISRLDNLDTRRLAALVNEAWLTLHDPEKRKAYDESLQAGGSPGAAPNVPPLRVEDLSDRARAYVDQLERSRAQWDATRKRAEDERVANEREALLLAQARETALQAGARRAGPAPVAEGLPRIPWSTVLTVVAVVAIVASGVWLLVRPQGAFQTIAGKVRAVPATPIRSQGTPTPHPTAQAIGNAEATPGGARNAPQHFGSAAQATTVPVRPTTPSRVTHVSPELARIARAPARGVAVPHQAPSCVNTHVSSVVNGSVVETGDGSYRVDNPTMQRQLSAWTAGDAVTICTQTAPDGSSFSLLANGVRGTVQGVAAGAPAVSYSNVPVCMSTKVTRVTDDGAMVLTSDGRAFLVEDNMGMRQEARSWGTPAAVSVCTTTAHDGSIHASIVASDTISVQATLQRSH